MATKDYLKTEKHMGAAIKIHESEKLVEACDSRSADAIANAVAFVEFHKEDIGRISYDGYVSKLFELRNKFANNCECKKKVLHKSEEEKRNISKIKDTIELTFGKINHDVKVCNLTGMSRSMIRITDNARALKEQNNISSSEYLDIVNRMDNKIAEASTKCKCRTI